MESILKRGSISAAESSAAEVATKTRATRNLEKIGAVSLLHRVDATVLLGGCPLRVTGSGRVTAPGSYFMDEQVLQFGKFAGCRVDWIPAEELNFCCNIERRTWEERGLLLDRIRERAQARKAAYLGRMGRRRSKGGTFQW